MRASRSPLVRLLGVALVAVAVVGVTACGDDDQAPAADAVGVTGASGTVADASADTAGVGHGRRRPGDGGRT